VLGKPWQDDTAARGGVLALVLANDPEVATFGIPPVIAAMRLIEGLVDDLLPTRAIRTRLNWTSVGVFLADAGEAELRGWRDVLLQAAEGHTVPVDGGQCAVRFASGVAASRQPDEDSWDTAVRALGRAHQDLAREPAETRSLEHRPVPDYQQADWM
jgi:hypothetical protein